MKSVKVLSAFLLGALSLAACTSPVIHSTTTHVKDLVQSDVFDVLPENELEVLIYNSPEEIEGEYLTLAMVEVKEISSDWSEKRVLNQLKEETELLGANGILVLKKTKLQDGEEITKEWKAIAVYAMDRVPLNNQLVSL